jgi:hypothetical protein
MGWKMISMTFEEQQESLERRKAELGLTGTDYVLPNSGVSRTPEKRALLRAMKQAADERGVELPFKASF